jgi:O-antigen/teichoic acid export membrane protein
MGVIIRQSSWALVANYLGVVIGFVNVMLIMPAVLEPGQIGLINLILSISFLVYPFLDLSATALLNRYFTNADSPRQMLNFSWMVQLAGAALFLLLFLLGRPLFNWYYGQESPEIIPYYWWIYGLSIALAAQYLLENYSTINRQLHVNIFIKEVVFRLYIFLFILLFYFQLLSFHTYLTLHIGSYLLAALSLALFLYLKGYLNADFKRPSFSSSQIREMRNYGSFMLISSLPAILAIRIDTLMLGSMKGLEQVAVYSLAMFMVALVDIPRRMLLQSSFPILRQAIFDQDTENVQKIQQKTILNLVVISGAMLTLLLINIEDIYKIIPNGHLYSEGTWVVIFLGLTKLSEMFNGANYEIFQASRHYRYVIFFFIILAVAAVGFNFLLIPKYSATGAAFATLLASLLVTLYKIGLFHRLFRLKVYSVRLAGILMVFFLIGAACYSFPLPFHPIVSVVARSIVAGILIGLYLLYFNISPDLTRLILSIFSSVIKKVR